MKITRKIARAIKAACREECGGRRAVEIGFRWWPSMPDDAEQEANFLLWGEDNDLSETQKIDELVGTEIAGRDGWVALDCYCYNLPLFGVEPDDFLDTNVSVLLAPDGTVAAVGGVSGDNFDEVLAANGQPPVPCY